MEFWKNVWDSILLFIGWFVSLFLSGVGAIFAIQNIAQLESTTLILVALTLGFTKVLKGAVVILTGYLNELLNKSTAGRNREKWYTQISEYLP